MGILVLYAPWLYIALDRIRTDTAKTPFSMRLVWQLYATGLATAALADTLRHARLVRRARLWLEGPADLREAERRLDRLTVEDLTPEERLARLESRLYAMLEAYDDSMAAEAIRQAVG